MDVKVGVPIRPTFKFYAAVAVSSLRAFSLALISLIITFISYILSSNFQFNYFQMAVKIYLNI